MAKVPDLPGGGSSSGRQPKPKPDVPHAGKDHRGKRGVKPKKVEVRAQNTDGSLNISLLGALFGRKGKKK